MVGVHHRLVIGVLEPPIAQKLQAANAKPEERILIQEEFLHNLSNNIIQKKKEMIIQVQCLRDHGRQG